MKHTEVMIGNYVEYHGKVYQIHAISKELPCLDTIELGIGVVEWKDLKPVEISKEWLLKMGFHKEDNGLDRNDTEYVEWYVLSMEGMNKVDDFVADDDNKIAYWGHKELRYIHEIQNLVNVMTAIKDYSTND